MMMSLSAYVVSLNQTVIAVRNAEDQVGQKVLWNKNAQY